MEALPLQGQAGGGKPLNTLLVPSSPGAATAGGHPCGHFLGVTVWLLKGRCGTGHAYCCRPAAQHIGERLQPGRGPCRRHCKQRVLESVALCLQDLLDIILSPASAMPVCYRCG